MTRTPITHSAAEWLPTTVKEVEALGWDYLDIILFSGDAYVDHPAFGAAVIGRLLQAEGYRVAIVPQPNWRDDLRDFRKLGKPRLFFGVSGGSMDSMVNHYTANLRLRSDDAYTPGGKAGFRPDRAVTVYTRILKSLYPNTPVVIGGIEASLRRLTHYDYWSDSLHPSLLIDSGADLLMYGMGDKSIIDVARAMKNGFNAKLLRRLPQVAFLADEGYVARLAPETTLTLHSYEECLASKRAFAENFVRIETESNRLRQEKILVEYAAGKPVVVNPPYPALTEAEIDRSFDLPYTRLPHPRYTGKGDIPAYEMIKYSVNIHRGCFGGCSFCTISAHQGKIHLLAQRTFRTGRNREGHPHGGLQRVYLRHRRPLGQHVRHGRPRHIAVQPVHAPLLPAPENPAPISTTAMPGCWRSTGGRRKSRASRKPSSAAVSVTTCSTTAPILRRS